MYSCKLFHILEKKIKMANVTTDLMTTKIMNLTTHLTTVGMANVTTPLPSTEISEAWGFSMAGIAILFYGSNFVPIKKFETGDGKNKDLYIY
jgi:hypothetical protein